MTAERENIVYFPSTEARQNRVSTSHRPEFHNFREKMFGTAILIGGLYLMYRGGKNLAQEHYLAGIALMIIGGIFAYKGTNMIRSKDASSKSPSLKAV